MKLPSAQPPVGYRVPMGDLIGAAAAALTRGPGSTEPFLSQLAQRLGVRHAAALSSGKAALAVVLQALHALTGRRKVIIPAYTCYSVPSAILKAGLDPVPCDIARGTFDYDYAQLDALLGQDVLCVLSVHLFGIPSDTGRAVRLCHPKGIFVVEDAAQAMGVRQEDRWLGTRADVGIFSLGRGKNVTAGGGGLAVTDSPDIAREIDARISLLPPSKSLDDLKTFCMLSVLSVFVSPRLYWIPASLPFLKLGETIFHEDVPIERFSFFRSQLLRNWEARLEGLSVSRRRAAAFYLANIAGASDFAPGLPYLRFPLLTDGDVRNRILSNPEARRHGISHMYPSSIGRIPQLQHQLTTTEFPHAERAARTLVTLPTHPLLSDGDLARICELVNAAVRARPRPRAVDRPLSPEPAAPRQPRGYAR